MPALRIILLLASVAGVGALAFLVVSQFQRPALGTTHCEMDAIKNMGYQQGDWIGPAGRYLYACMRAAGYDLKSHKTPEEGYCTFGDMRRIVLPECYQPQ